MKKVTSFLMVAAIAFGFAACNSEDGPNVDTRDGKTYTRVTVQQSQDVPSTRALNEGVIGTQKEDHVGNGYLFYQSNPSQNIPLTKKTDPASGNPGTSAVWTSAAFETTLTGIQNVAFFLNNRLALNAADYSPTKTISIDKLYDVIDLAGADKGFLMTSKTGSIDIQAGKSKETVEGSTTEADNNFNFTVERVVSKAQLRQHANALTTGKNIPGTISNLKYSIAGSAKKLYLFKDQAPDASRTLDGSTYEYTGYTSAIDSDGPTEYTNIQKLSDSPDNAPDATSDYNNFRVKDLLSTTTDPESGASGVYFFENSMSTVIAKQGDLFYNRIAYAKVYAKYVPADNEGYKLDGGNVVPAMTADYTGGTYTDVPVSDTWHDANPGLGYGGEAGSWTLSSMTDEPGTFYIGADGRIYTSLLASRAAGNEKSKKYDAGKMVYLTPLNAQKKDQTFVVNADTRRNNIYDLTVIGFDGIGSNYDRVDPSDPNIPQPTPNPDEPEIDEDVPVDPATTFMRVSATILNWNLVGREVTLK